MFDKDSIDRIAGSTAYDRNGDKIGTVGQLYTDDDTGQPSWATISTGFFGTSESFVPLDNAELDGDGNLRVGYDKDQVKDAPRVDDDGHIDRDEEARLYEHYSLSTEGRSTYADTDVDRDRDLDRDRDVDVDRSVDTDGSMTRSEERLNVGTEAVETGRVRLRKYVTEEEQTVTVPVKKEKLVVERNPIADGEGRAAGAIGDGDDVEEITLREERAVVDKETVAVEEVNVGKETVTENQEVTETVRKEQIDVEGDGVDDTRR